MTENHDKTFQQSKEKLKSLQKSHSDWVQSCDKLKSHKSPPAWPQCKIIDFNMAGCVHAYLKACVRKVHSALEVSNVMLMKGRHYHLVAITLNDVMYNKINSNHIKHNYNIQIIDHIIASKDYTIKD